MNVEKRTNYINHLYASIHTLSGIYEEPLNLSQAESIPLVRQANHKKVRNEERKVTYLMINPNRTQEDHGMVTSYSTFKGLMKSVFSAMNADMEKYHIRRADMSLNSDDPDDYELYKKLNRALICCVANEYKVVNSYATQDLWTFDSLNMAIKNDDFEMENYNKELESHGAVPTKSRLELRSKGIKDGKTLKHELMDKWFRRLDKASQSFKGVQMRYNDQLERLYKEDIQKPKKQRTYMNLTSFLMQYRECIFTTAQMIDLLSRFDEVRTPEIRAKNFKQRHHIEYISQTDINVVIKAIKRCIRQYFKS